ncbi:hypothetical protein Hanom_Chr00s000001g01597871 [Helianthus anomalus]
MINFRVQTIIFKSDKSSIGISSPIKSSSCNISSSMFNHEPISSPCSPRTSISGSCRWEKSSGSSVFSSNLYSSLSLIVLFFIATEEKVLF